MHEMPAPLYASTCNFCTSWDACSGLAGGDPTTVGRRFHAPPGSRSQPPGAAAAIRQRFAAASERAYFFCAACDLLR